MAVGKKPGSGSGPRKPPAARPKAKTAVRRNEHSVLEKLAAEAVAMGAHALEVEYQYRCHEVVALGATCGVGLALLPSSGAESMTLCRELTAVAYRRRRRLVLNGQAYRVRCEIYDSFGERAWRLHLEPVP
jgi:hypothetical protein